MPDISMCKSYHCPYRTNCYRHTASGTIPSEFGQSYQDFDLMRGDRIKCDDFIKVIKDDTR